VDARVPLAELGLTVAELNGLRGKVRPDWQSDPSLSLDDAAASNHRARLLIAASCSRATCSSGSSGRCVARLRMAAMTPMPKNLAPTWALVNSGASWSNPGSRKRGDAGSGQRQCARQFRVEALASRRRSRRS
jgi:hypothetical protein